MGRPGLSQNRKFRRLSMVLEGEAIARGHLELMWDSAYEAGDEVLGDALDVALAAQWKGDPQFIADAMAKTGFLDEENGIYIIHDFWHHAPAYVRKRRTREDARRSKVDPCRSSGSSVTSQSLDTDDKTAPLPHPHPHPHPHPKEKEQDEKASSPSAPVLPLVAKKEKKNRKVQTTGLKGTDSEEAFAAIWEAFPRTKSEWSQVTRQFEEVPVAPGAKLEAERNFQAIVDSGVCKANMLYFAFWAYLQESPKVKEGFIQQVSTFFGPKKATYLEWLDRAEYYKAVAFGVAQ